MQRFDTTDPAGGFHVLGTTERSQAATMVLGPGEKTGGPENRHPGSDQWLLVRSGQGEAIVEGEHVPLAPGRLLLIEAGDRHEIRSTGEAPLVTVNVYAAPAY